MKKTQIVATLAFAVMLGVAIPTINIISSTSVSATEQSDLSTSDQAPASTPVSTQSELVTALSNNEVSLIQLSSDLTFSSTVEVYRTSKVTVDLNGHTITSTNGSPFKIYQGEVEFSGEGTINGGANGNAIEVFGATTSITNYTIVTTGSNITLEAPSPKHYAISIPTPKGQSKPDVASYGIVVNFAGTIIANYGISINGNIQHIENCPQINILDGATITASDSVEDSTPIYAAGVGNWTIGRANLHGQAAIGVKAGTLTFNNTDIEIVGPEQIVSLASGKIIGTGSTFQLEHHPAYADQIMININGGTYSSAQSHVFYEYDDTVSRAATVPADINITSGAFIAATDKSIFSGFGAAGQADIEISGGTFKGNDVADFKTNGYLVGNLSINADGTVFRPSSNRPSGDVEAPEDSSNPEVPIDPTPTPDTPQDKNKVPDTGVLSQRGIISAVSTLVPMLICAGFAFMFFSGKIHERHRLRHLAALESEMNAEIHEIVDEPEDDHVVNRFIAVPIARDEPITATVDPFVPHH